MINKHFIEIGGNGELWQTTQPVGYGEVATPKPVGDYIGSLLAVPIGNITAEWVLRENFTDLTNVPYQDYEKSWAISELAEAVKKEDLHNINHSSKTHTPADWKNYRKALIDYSITVTATRPILGT